MRDPHATVSGRYCSKVVPVPLVLFQAIEVEVAV